MNCLPIRYRRYATRFALDLEHMSMTFSLFNSKQDVSHEISVIIGDSELGHMFCLNIC